MRNIFSELVGSFIFMLPLIVLIAWGLFRVLYKNKPETRVFLIFLVCIITALGLIIVRQYGRQTGFSFTTADWVMLVDGIIAAGIGTVFWKKPNPKDPMPPKTL